MPPVTVRLSFCEALHPPTGAEAATVVVDLEEGDTVSAAKQKIAAALGGAVTPSHLLLHFPPVDAVIGAAHTGDPGVDEGAATLGAFSALAWIRRFPHWPLGARPLPPAPPAPGVAAHTAAALAEGKDAAGAVAAARARVRGVGRETVASVFSRFSGTAPTPHPPRTPPPPTPRLGRNPARRRPARAVGPAPRGARPRARAAGVADGARGGRLMGGGGGEGVRACNGARAASAP
jgi:hypothetical protein